MSEGNEKFKAGRNDEDGPEVEGHKKGFSEDMPGKKGLTEDDGPEVEGHKFGSPEKAYKKG